MQRKSLKELKVKMAEKLKGGKADCIPDFRFNPKQLSKGIKEELGEHTKHKGIAKEIAKDHLIDNSNYYKDLAEMEKKAKKRKQKDDLDVFGVQEFMGNF